MKSSTSALWPSSRTERDLSAPSPLLVSLVASCAFGCGATPSSLEDDVAVSQALAAAQADGDDPPFAAARTSTGLVAEFGDQPVDMETAEQTCQKVRVRTPNELVAKLS